MIFSKLLHNRFLKQSFHSMRLERDFVWQFPRLGSMPKLETKAGRKEVSFLKSWKREHPKTQSSSKTNRPLFCVTQQALSKGPSGFHHHNISIFICFFLPLVHGSSLLFAVLETDTKRETFPNLMIDGVETHTKGRRRYDLRE